MTDLDGRKAGWEYRSPNLSYAKVHVDVCTWQYAKLLPASTTERSNIANSAESTAVTGTRRPSARIL